ncbi:MAG: lytic transglycosylase domain-containing protein [Defluviitaleaceae bacterium]|nr:lytic transglycosylase domain-containing protein [Defluviitaleaceae bacterium]
MKSKKKLSKFFKFIFLVALLFFAGLMLIYTVFPVKHFDIIERYAAKHGLEPAFVCAMIFTESRFREGAVSHAGATGLMQIMPGTAYWAAEQMGIENFSYENIKDPEINISIGTWYIARLIRQYGEVDTALAAYNAGSGKVSAWLRDNSFSDDSRTLHTIPYRETREYIGRINMFYRIYRIRLRLRRN